MMERRFPEVWRNGGLTQQTIHDFLRERLGDDAFLKEHTGTLPGLTTAQAARPESTMSEELRELAAAVPGRAIDADMARTISRALAIDASDAATILETLNDRELSQRVRQAFRRLILEADTPEGRWALLETIDAQGRLASGLEIDAVVANLSFDGIEETVRPYWDRLPKHHRGLVLDAMRKAATTGPQRTRVQRLSERWLDLRP